MKIQPLPNSLQVTHTLTKFLGTATFVDLRTKLKDKDSGKTIGCARERNCLYILKNQSRQKKLDPRVLSCVFVGHSSTQKGYKCFHPLSKKFFVSWDVTFHEEEPYFTQPYLQGENFKEDKLDSLDLSGIELNTLNLSSINSNTSGDSDHDSNTLDLSHSGHDSNILNLSGLESNPPNSSSFESNRPNLSGLELNTFVPDPSEAEEVGVESNQSNTPIVELRPKVDVRYGKNLVYMRKSKVIPESTQVQESDSAPSNEVINYSEL
ncbi:hypothetical protein KIW84_057617 [Lathyrus oleraceus]|uniref:Retroviral polymerase SH3-like domain-containing protein n=1 Tax=Pisum sativum TaxID=3888 RepID=A0A9D4X3R2_PEA|nr:hypothetical protein KIW84_057617 [Pisum sativum]